MIGPVGRMASRARSLDSPIAVLAAMAFITQLGVSVMLPLLPLYAQSLGATPFVLSLLVGGFAIALAGGQLASGFLAERFASRRLSLCSPMPPTGAARAARSGPSWPCPALES